MKLHQENKGGTSLLLKKAVSALGVAGLLGLAACGSGDGGSSSSEDGVKEGPGVTATEINLGILSDYSGPIAEGATAGTVGMEVYFDTVNDDGGVCGRKLVVTRQDTKYDAQLTVQGYRAIQNKVLMIPQIVGTAGLMAISDSIEKANVPTISASLNTVVMELPDVYLALPPFEVELINGLVWAAEEAGASEDNTVTVASVTPSDDFGKRYAEAIAFAAEHTPGVELVEEVNYAPTDEDFTAQVSKLKTADADIVLLGTDPGKTAGFVGSAAQLGYDPTWVSSSGAWAAPLAAPLEGLLDDFYVSGGYSTLNDDDEGITALEAAVEKYAPKQEPDNFLVGGWLMAQATVAGLEKACENKDLTREGVIEAFEDLKVDYRGSAGEIDFGNGDQIVGYASRINTIGEGGVQEALTDFTASDAAKDWGADKGF